MRDSFIFYRSFYEALTGMDKESQADCLMAIANYALNDVEPELTPEVRLFFTLVKPQVDANKNRYKNGQKGGRPRKDNNQEETKSKPNNNQKETKPKPNVNDNVNVNVKENLIKEKIKLDEVFDWESLFTYWEQNKKGGKYKNTESRNRQLAKLKQLTNQNYDFAKEAILFCLDNNYQGFTDGQKLYYRGTDVRGDSNTEETVTIDESLKFDETMPEFKDMTFDDCCRAYNWLQDKMYLQVITKPKFVELVRKFKGVA